MENHPIPQDITGFQFKLVGNMTIKQFVYLAVGAIFAWLFFFMFNLPTILKWPLTIISISLGAIIAFVPIDGRPMDVMLRNFFKAILSPTQFIYQKEGGKLLNQPPHSQVPGVKTAGFDSPQKFESRVISGFQPGPTMNQTQTALTAAPVPAQGDSNPTHHHSFLHDFKDSFEHKKKPKDSGEIKDIKKENRQLKKEVEEIKKSMEKIESSQAPTQTPLPDLSQATAAQTQIVQPPIYTNPPTPTSMTIEQVEVPDDIKKKEEELANLGEEKDKLQKEVESLKKQLEEALKAKEQAAAPPPPPPVAPLPSPLAQQANPSQDELEKKLIESNRQKEALEKELVSIQSKAQEKPEQAFSPVIAKPIESTQNVRSVPLGMEKSVGIPSIPDFPNLITGIVKDSRGNPLQNILIEVKDQDSNPVRAFKTNGLGKFASATSLSNGKYVISFEDTAETHKFDAVELELVGAPVMPLEIISVDPREELRRELFN